MCDVVRDIVCDILKKYKESIGIIKYGKEPGCFKSRKEDLKQSGFFHAQEAKGL